MFPFVCIALYSYYGIEYRRHSIRSSDGGGSLFGTALDDTFWQYLSKTFQPVCSYASALSLPIVEKKTSPKSERGTFYTAGWKGQLIESYWKTIWVTINPNLQQLLQRAIKWATVMVEGNVKTCRQTSNCDVGRQNDLEMAILSPTWANLMVISAFMLA